MKEDILLIGSAGYMPEWVEKNKDLLGRYKVFAMNNAWALCADKVHTWLRSSDFFALQNTIKPTIKDVDRWNVVRGFDAFPYWYQKKGSGTMILNCLYHILNKFQGNLLSIRLAGCDLMYPDKESHFYKGGTPDPMRLGADYLSAELRYFDDLTRRLGIRVFNIGGQAESLLPFDRRSF